MRHMICGILIVFSFVFAYAATAEATYYLFTTTAFSNNQEVFCAVTNVDSHPVTITVRLFDTVPHEIGGASLDIDTCGGGGNFSLPVGATCRRGTTNTAGATGLGILCRITSTSKHVKGAVEVRDLPSGNLLLMYPATLY